MGSLLICILKMKKILMYFISWKILVLIGAYLATFLAPISYNFTTASSFGLKLPYYLWIWANFDGGHYLRIANEGYRHLLYPFFPLYPLSIHILDEILKALSIHLPLLASGFLVSNIAFFLALLVMIRMLILDREKNLIPLILLIVITYPTSFFYGALYNDSLFFLLASLTIFFARNRNFLAAGILGGLATLTRLNGLALIFLIAFEYMGFNWNFKNITSELKSKISVKEILRTKIYLIALIPAAFVGYLFYINQISGDWQNLFTTMRIWNQSEPTIPIQVAYRYLKIFLSVPPQTLVFWVAVFEALSVAFYVAMLVFSFKKMRFSYWIFFAVSILIPSLTGTFSGMPRYGLHLYPFFLSIALFLERKSLDFKLRYFIISLALFLFAITLFTRGYFVS